jgi:hypothetical protein
MRVDHRRAHIGVAEKLQDRADIGAHEIREEIVAVREADGLSQEFAPMMTAQRLIAATFVSLLLVGCKEERHVSAFIFENESAATIACLDQQTAEVAMEWEYPHAPQQRQQEIAARLEKATAKCSTVAQLIENLAESRAELEKGFSVPAQRYFLDVSAMEDSNALIGFFESVEDCESSRVQLTAVGVQASECFKRTVFLKSVWS